MAGEVLAVGWSIVANLGGDRQITFQSAFAVDMTDAEKNKLLDDTMALVDRQKARSELPDVRAELFKHRETLAQYEEDLGRVDTMEAEKVAELQRQIAELEDETSYERLRDAAMAPLMEKHAEIAAARMSEWNAGQAEFDRAGKQGAYQPRGHRQVNLDRIDKTLAESKAILTSALVDHAVDRQNSIDTLKQEVTRLLAEREVARGNLEVNVKRFQAAIANREVRITELEALIGE
jgi:hypothetical protein